MSDTSAPAHNPRLSSMGRFTVKGTAGEMSDVTDLIERITPALKLLKDMETGQRCADYAYAEADGFQAMTYIPEAFEALRALPDVIAALANIKQTDAVEVERWQPIETAPRDGKKMHAVGRCDGKVYEVYANPELCKQSYSLWFRLPPVPAAIRGAK